MGPPIVIVGGGLAGLAAAVRLTEAGREVVLIESKRKLGGRATSFVDPRSGEMLDNCQHVLMGSCTNLLDLYGRLGVLDLIEWHRTIWWANPPSDPDEMTPGALPAPAHFTRSFLRMRFLGLEDKRAVARAMWRLIRLGREGRERWKGQSFGAFLDETRQTERARSHFWEPVIISACNMPCARTEASLAMYVFQAGFLQDSWSPVMGLSVRPLVELYDPAQQFIESRGGAMRLGVSALSLSFDGTRVRGVVTDEGMVEASAVITAVPPDRLAKLCSGTLTSADVRLGRLDEIAFSPILGVHLAFDAPIMETPHLVLPGRDTQWLFRKDRDAQGRHRVHAVISAADSWMDLEERAIVDRVMRDVHWALPRARGLQPVAFRAVKEKRATFAGVPGIDALRPKARRDGVRGGVENLFLAGDWCATGWPATMEGAVRSGYLASAAVCGRSGDRCEDALVPDVPAAPLSRWLGL